MRWGMMRRTHLTALFNLFRAACRRVSYRWPLSKDGCSSSASLAGAHRDGCMAREFGTIGGAAKRGEGAKRAPCRNRQTTIKVRVEREVAAHFRELPLEDGISGSPCCEEG